MLQGEALRCRAAAIECFGLVAEAVGKDALAPVIPEFVAAAFQVLLGIFGA